MSDTPNTPAETAAQLIRDADIEAMTPQELAAHVAPALDAVRYVTAQWQTAHPNHLVMSLDMVHLTVAQVHRDAHRLRNDPRDFMGKTDAAARQVTEAAPIG